MKKLLILGINTRPFVNSALQLNYETYSSSYYKTLDFKNPHKERHVLKQAPNKSCGFFEKNYSPRKLLDLCEDWINNVNHIILSTGISPNDFNISSQLKKNKKKIIGNKDIENIENKYKFYKKIRNKFLVPLTFKIKDISEALEINTQYPNKEFIIKPLKGSGGYDVELLESLKDSKFETKFSKVKNSYIVQEFQKGKNISSSLLSTKKEAKNIIISENFHNSLFNMNNNNNKKKKNDKNNKNKIKNENKLQNKDYDFRYGGNIVPINKSKYPHILEKIGDISEKIITNFKLIGSNGVDFIIKDEEIYILEINPRFQGTYECVENVLGINLLNAHIKACENELIEMPLFSSYSMKKIIYSQEKIKFENNKHLNNKHIFDLPYNNTIIEKKEPLLTIITHENSISKNKNLMTKIEKEIEIEINKMKI